MIRRNVAKYLTQSSRGKHLKEPYLLTLGLRLRRWEVLPFDGGLLDQPEALMQQIDAALDAYDEWRARQEIAPNVETVHADG